MEEEQVACLRRLQVAYEDGGKGGRTGRMARPRATGTADEHTRSDRTANRQTGRL